MEFCAPLGTDCSRAIERSPLEYKRRRRRRRDTLVVCSWRKVLPTDDDCRRATGASSAKFTLAHVAPVLSPALPPLPFTLLPLPFPCAFLYAERDLSSLVLVNGFRAHANVANPASIYSGKDVKARDGPLGRGRAFN